MNSMRNVNDLGAMCLVRLIKPVMSEYDLSAECLFTLCECECYSRDNIHKPYMKAIELTGVERAAFRIRCFSRQTKFEPGKRYLCVK